MTKAQLLAKLRSLPAQVVQSASQAVGESLVEQIRRDFITKSNGGTGRDGVRWKPLKPSTLKAKRGPGMGRETETLFGSLSPASGGMTIRAVGGLVEVGSSVPYAKHFHRVRPMWPLSGRPPSAWRTEIIKAVAGKLGKAVVRLIS